MNNQKREGIAFFNDRFQVGDDGWGMVAPFGSWKGIGAEKTPGGVRRFKAVQRIDHESATELVNQFNSISGRIKRWLVGVPIYEGHPDAVGIGHRYPNKNPVGTAAELQVRSDGLYARPVFTNEGARLLASTEKLGFSVRASGRQVGEQDGLPVFVWSEVHSLGLTPNPNLPVQFLNEQDHTIMNKDKIIAWLKVQGVELANDAGEEQIEAGLAKLGDRITGLLAIEQGSATLKTELSNATETLGTRDTELKAARDEAAAKATEFANERAHRINLMLDLGIAAGRITSANREEWKTKLTADFPNALTEWEKLPVTVKTAAATAGRKPGVELANEASRRTAAMDKVHALMKSAGLTYNDAFARIRAQHPELFGSGAAPAAPAQGAPIA